MVSAERVVEVWIHDCGSVGAALVSVCAVWVLSRCLCVQCGRILVDWDSATLRAMDEQIELNQKLQVTTY